MLKDDKQVIEKYKKEIELFKDFCSKFGNSGRFEEINFYDLSLGFFMALGLTDNLDNPGLESPAFALARICRYDFQYWC